VVNPTVTVAKDFQQPSLAEIQGPGSIFAGTERDAAVPSQDVLGGVGNEVGEAC
jgi:hypothetical protein